MSIHNKLDTNFAQGTFQLYILRDNPMKSAAEYANGLNSQYDGFQLTIMENKIRNNKKKFQSDPAYVNFVEG